MAPAQKLEGIAVTRKGQVTIPKPLRDKLRLKPGDKVDFIERDSEIVVRRHFDTEAFKAAIEKWSGILGPLPEGQSVDDLISEMRDGW
jgi:AbrB family looped-hinge helix DNA binding protein